MILMRFLPHLVVLGLLVTAWYKISNYIDEHEALEAAYDRQALELDQAVEVNVHNIDELARIQSNHEQTLFQLQGQLDSEATTMISMEDQIARLRSLASAEPEIRYVTANGESCPDPDSVVSSVLADPFGMPVQPPG